MLRTAAILLGLFSLLFTAPGFAYSSQQTWLEPDFVARAFIDVALRNEYSSGQKPLVKWQEPIRVWVKHDVADRELHDELTNAHLRHLSSITGLTIKRVSSRKEANIVWIYSNDAKWEKEIEREMGKSSLKHVRDAICKAGYRIGNNSAIVSASIVIPVDRARMHGKLIACVVEEITQTLGLPNDSDSAFPSIFNDNTPEDLLSPLDVVLLKLLYEPELKVGMTERQVTPIVKRLLKRYQQDGTLDKAVSVAKSGELFQLIGY